MTKEDEDFFNKFTFAQAAALAMVLKYADVPREMWAELGGVFAKSFQIALKGEIDADKNTN